MSYPPFPWVKMTLTSIGLIGLGYGLMKTTVPTEEELYSRMAPDLQRRVDARRAARLAMEKEAMQQGKAQTHDEEQDPDSQKPVWANSSSKR
ncbi:hypothetical protein BDZ89DRAFT_586299 [Hymenopellis radicata]|nr:hypothetical protein BDZ89DRAFT_586299 [Hymenopellis radicata]